MNCRLICPSLQCSFPFYATLQSLLQAYLFLNTTPPMAVLLLSFLTHNISYATHLTTLSFTISSPILHDRPSPNLLLWKPYLYLYHMLTNPTHRYTLSYPVTLYHTCTIIHLTLIYHITTIQTHYLPIFTTLLKLYPIPKMPRFALHLV